MYKNEIVVSNKTDGTEARASLHLWSKKQKQNVVES